MEPILDKALAQEKRQWNSCPRETSWHPVNNCEHFGKRFSASGHTIRAFFLPLSFHPSSFPFGRLRYRKLVCVWTCLLGDISKSGLNPLWTLLSFSLCCHLSYTCYRDTHSNTHVMHTNAVWQVTYLVRSSLLGGCAFYRATSRVLLVHTHTRFSHLSKSARITKDRTTKLVALNHQIFHITTTAGVTLLLCSQTFTDMNSHMHAIFFSFSFSISLFCLLNC